MIKLRKGNLTMKVGTDVQASAFIRNGWVRVGEENKNAIPVAAEQTNDVPEGALDTNPDGSANAYDENGNVVGTVDAETVQKLQEEAGKAYSKTEIFRMKTDDLKLLAPTLGIEITKESTGAKLKEEIIEKLGL